MTGRALRYVPALDGLRGMAVAVVIAFHSGYAWASGGFLGVSMFFTLSGYLITSLLLAEREQEGAIHLAGFYRRRAARLLPASLLGLLLALAVGLASTPVSTELRGDLLAALGQVANWRWLMSSQSYADLFSAPSPVLHYWSLAIEEQFYLVFPPLLVWARRGSLGRLRGIVGVGLLGSWVLLVAFVAFDLRDAAYYATPARFGEILAGAALGCVAAPAALRHRFGRLARLGAPALLVLGLAVVLVDPAGRWTYAIWLPVTSVLSLLLIVGAGRGGRLSRGLSWGPLVGLGRISYGAYVFHWPIFLYLTPARTGLSQHPLTAVRVAATLAVSVLSYKLVEQPLLHGVRAPRPRRRLVLGTLAVGWVVVAAVVVVAAGGSRPVTNLAEVEVALRRDRAVEAPPETPRVAYFGDSTAAVMSYALVRWGGPVDRVEVTAFEVPLGCGLELPGDRRMRGKMIPISEKCHAGAARWPATMSESGARIAIIQSGVWEATDHRFPDDPGWRALGDPELDAEYRERFLAAVDGLLAGGAERVVWLTSPAVDIGRSDVNSRPMPESDPARIRRYNELVREVAAQRPQVVVLDLGALIDAWPDAEDAARRPDGIHLSEEAALDLVETWLGPALLDVSATLDRS